jgi:hypothetical protein
VASASRSVTENVPVAVAVLAVAAIVPVVLEYNKVEASAFAGTTDNRPKPNADTATSATRLIDVFVDICFLSLKVELEAFSNSAWRRRTHSSDMSDCSFCVRATFCAL